MENEIKNMAAELKNEIYAAIEKANTGKITQKELDLALAEFSQKAVKELKDNEITQLKNELIEIEKKRQELFNIVKEQGEKLNQKDAPAANENYNFAEKLHIALKEANLLGETIQTKEGDTKTPLKGFDSPNVKGRINIPMGAKAAVDMTTVNTMGSDAVKLSVFYDPLASLIPLSTNRHVDQVFPSQRITEKYYALVVEHTEWDGADTKPEGTASGQSSFLLKSVEFKVFTIETNYRVSRENLEDVDLLVTEISRRGTELLNKKIDSKVLVATGDDSSDIKGLLHADKSTAIDFLNTQTDYAGTIDDPYIVDVLAAAQSVIADADFNANIVILNNKDINALTAKKDADSNSIMDRRVVYGANGVPTMISGMLLFRNNTITANTALIAQADQVVLAKRRDITIDFGYDGNDFTEGMMTFRISMRMALGVRNKAALAYIDDISQAIEDLTVAVAS